MKINKLPLLFLKNIVMFPNMIITLFITKKKFIKTATYAMDKNINIILIAYKNYKENYDTYKIGCISKIIQFLKFPNGNLKLLIQGVKKIKIFKIKYKQSFLINFLKIKEFKYNRKEIKTLRNSILNKFEIYTKTSNKFYYKITKSLKKIQSINKILFIISYYLLFTIKERQKILETLNIFRKTKILLKKLNNELSILDYKKKIFNKIKRKMEKSQREYYLNEQVRIINEELGNSNDINDFYKLKKKIFSSKMSKEAFDKSISELEKLKLMPIMSSESSVTKNYIETLISLPWNKKTIINNDILKVQEILNSDHYGLKKIKERILEYLAVQKRINNLKGPILCFIGPPGVGKTSLGKSIAKATNRNFIRISLGGVHDEGEIRGHRKTYIGSMPGKIIQNLIKAKVNNPLFLLDEIDKLGIDFKSDPASALLEVLDSEQNNTFSDHYLEVDFDLSKVMFIATANTYNIHPALLDRMEIINLSSYTPEEKIKIALNHLLPKQIKNNGLKNEEIKIFKSAIKKIINFYIREAGVRSLEKQISKICRKVVKILTLNKKKKKITITNKNLKKFLGIPIFDKKLTNKKNQIGQINGLAWTEIGGELLTIEAVILPGNGEIITTGTLGKVMKESINTAYTVAQIILLKKGINKKIFKKNNLHINIPEGGIPKDGPSAGIAITVVIISVFTNIPININIAMTGEITLRGEILKIGGLKEKIFAAYQNKIKTVIIPKKNIKILEKISKKIKKKLKILPINYIEDVLKVSLETEINLLNK
ncbi:endopeptidase La [Candidatus Zinderia endosymbiont of Aphrophora alni]|uniref:endopeptidase La n=1 Tax=Candidatus Zinderia endosymbiont of Aphrophora alni TaxID=3077951 RepID=UPI0030D02771